MHAFQQRTRVWTAVLIAAVVAITGVVVARAPQARSAAAPGMVLIQGHQVPKSTVARLGRPVFGRDTKGRETATYAANAALNAALAATPEPCSRCQAGWQTVTQINGSGQYKGRTLGPTADTFYAKATLHTFVRSGSHVSNNVTIVNENPTVADRGAQANSWYNPFSWNWPHIMSRIWRSYVAPCLDGAIGSASFAFAASTGSHILFWSWTFLDDVLTVSPQGFVFTMIGGCFAGILRYNATNGD